MITFKALTIRYELMVIKVRIWVWINFDVFYVIKMMVNKVWVVVNKLEVMIVITNSANTGGQRTLFKGRPLGVQGQIPSYFIDPTQLDKVYYL